jgi:hypothetical protein
LCGGCGRYATVEQQTDHAMKKMAKILKAKRNAGESVTVGLALFT